MNTVNYEKIGSLTPEELQASWTTNLKKGDSFKYSGETHQVTCHTKKTLKIQSSSNKFSFKKYNNIIYGTGKSQSFLLEVEGVIIIDLLNRHNPFHAPSDFLILLNEVISSSLDEECV
jgi:hypothetical protein